MKADQLMVPVYINEKIVLDMLAIIEDGFSTVSQVSYTEHKENSNYQKLEAGVSTSATLLSKLLKIDLKGELSHSGNSGENESVAKENETVKQIKSFADELKHSGTIDFILSDTAGTVVLSAQEQYLSNDNISEIIGGHFKVLGKVIAICKDETENIDLLRKTTLSILPIDLLTEPFSGFQNDDTKQFNLPELKTQISGPAVIVIPVAIYA